ncbi:MAG: indole-3-glycerol phosphate synthase TrpC, partial [Alphaproteobacteria bacterium]
IRPDFDPVSLAKAYEAGGATCLSVLTDAPFFQGQDQYLRDVRPAVSLPCLRKDFMIDTYQIQEARALGADCILIIIASLDDALAADIEAATFELGMDALIEVHNEDELERALTHLKSDLLGVNNRDLVRLSTDLSTTERLSKMVPDGKLMVSESGLFTNGDLKRMSKVGANSFLIGESLMRNQDVATATKTILGEA